HHLLLYCPTRRSSDLFGGRVRADVFQLPASPTRRPSDLDGGRVRADVFRLPDAGGDVQVRGVRRVGQGAPVSGRIRSALTRSVRDRKSTRLNSSHSQISYAVFCLKKKSNNTHLNHNHTQN